MFGQIWYCSVGGTGIARTDVRIVIVNQDFTKFQTAISDCIDVIEKSFNKMRGNRYSRDTLQLDEFVSEVITQSQLSNSTKPVL